jgi:hypothetical protein
VALETTGDPHGVLVQDVNRRLNELAEQQHAVMPGLRHHKINPPGTNNQAPELLDRVGQVSSSKLERASNTYCARCSTRSP